MISNTFLLSSTHPQVLVKYRYRCYCTTYNHARREEIGTTTVRARTYALLITAFIVRDGMQRILLVADS